MNHLTPDELASRLGISAEEVLRLCQTEGIPVWHGRIDRRLFEAAVSDQLQQAAAS